MTVAAAALSEHPLATHAVGEAVGRLLDVGGPRPDLVVLFCTEAHLGVLDDVARALRHLLEPRVLIGSSAAGVMGGAREVRDRAGMSVLAVWFGGSPLRGVRLLGGSGAERPTVVGLDPLEGAEGTLLVLSDPFSLPLQVLAEHLSERAPGLAVIGGAASSARRAGGNRLLLDGALHADGAVAVHLGASVPVEVVLSQGCRPVGEPFTVTGVEGDLVTGLGGRPALDRLRDTLDGLDEGDRALAGSGLQLGQVVDEQREEFRRGDFVVRDVLGAGSGRGAVLLGAAVTLGSTAQFHVRDPASARSDLLERLSDRDAVGALCCSDTERDATCFGCHDHDPEAITEALPTAALAGAFLSGTLGPVGGRSVLHDSAAGLLLFC